MTFSATVYTLYCIDFADFNLLNYGVSLSSTIDLCEIMNSVYLIIIICSNLISSTGELSYQ